jgi:hypothetical protein
MRRLAGSLVLALVGLIGARAEPGAELQARMTGRFRVAESDGVLQERLAAAIDHAVEPMNFIARPIARSRLRSVVYYCQQYEMALGPDTVRIACDDRQPIERRLDNSEGPVAGLQSEPADVKVEIAGDSVELVVTGSDGTRTTSYRFGADGALEVSVKVTSPRLQRPVTWKVRYLKIRAA